MDTAFIDGFRAGSWVSAAVVFAGGLIALRFLPRHAAAAAPAAVAEQDELAVLVGEVEVAPAV